MQAIQGQGRMCAKFAWRNNINLRDKSRLHIFVNNTKMKEDEGKMTRNSTENMQETEDQGYGNDWVFEFKFSVDKSPIFVEIFVWQIKNWPS